MSESDTQFGIVDNRFLSRSIGLLDPPEPLTLHQRDSLDSALTLMRKERMGCIVLTDAMGLLTGIFTERDVLMKLNLEEIKGDRLLSEVMTSDPKTVQMTDSIAFVLQLMSEGGFRHVPVVDENKYPVGIVSVKDIVNYIVRSVQKDLGALSDS